MLIARRYNLCLPLILLILSAAGCGKTMDPFIIPGLQDNGSFILTNGRFLTPAGGQISVGEFPQGLALSHDGTYAVVSNIGSSGNSISIIDIENRLEVQRIPVSSGAFGICFSPDNGHIYVSLGSENIIEIFRFSDDAALHIETLTMQAQDNNRAFFPAGLALSKDGSRLISANLLDNSISIFDLQIKEIAAIIPVGEMPFAVTIHPDGNTAFVSNWGGKSVSVIDLENFTEASKIPTGSHPNQLVLSSDGRKLFVANANSDNVTVINTDTKNVVETINVSPFPRAPAGSQPNGIALSGDGSTLFVVNAGDNAVSVIDVSRNVSLISGLIPTGEYPTAVKLSDNQLIVTNRSGGKDSSEDANSKDKNNSGEHGNPGTVSFIQIPDNAQLSEYTQRVRKNNGYEEMVERLEYGVNFREPKAIPRMQGEASLIRYVFYIIKGNLNYEQVFGEVPNRTGNVETPVFDRSVTPNYHALTEEFVLYDNFYVNGATRGEGLEWSTAAAVTDFVMRLAPVHGYNQGFPYPAEGAFPIASPDAGYLWDAANQKGLTYRLYGLFVSYLTDNKSSLTANLENLNGHFSPDYPPFDVNIPDTERAEIFIKELNRQADGNFIPKLNILYLPNDQLDRDFKDNLETSRVNVADSDHALGMIIEAISNSRIWKESVVFVVQGSSQTGYPADNRSIALAISPYGKHGFVDHTLYDTSSIIRSIGLMLGLEPLNQLDLGAIPLYNGFQQIALLEPYTAK